eukprot:jgi/Bigna1/137136/aug1.37_g11844
MESPQAGLAIALALLYSILSLSSLLQISRMVCNGHSLFDSFQASFLLLLLPWMALRAFFFAFEANLPVPEKFSLNNVAEILILRIPSALQFTTFSLIAVFYAKLLYQQDWPAKIEAIWGLFFVANCVAFSLTFGIQCDPDEAECNTFSRLTGVEYLLLTAIFSYFGMALVARSCSSRKIVVTALAWAAFLSRGIYCIMKTDHGPRSEIDLPSFIMHICWEILPSAAILYYFRSARISPQSRGDCGGDWKRGSLSLPDARTSLISDYGAQKADYDDLESHHNRFASDNNWKDSYQKLAIAHEELKRHSQKLERQMEHQSNELEKIHAAYGTLEFSRLTGRIDGFPPKRKLIQDFKSKVDTLIPLSKKLHRDVSRANSSTKISLKMWRKQLLKYVLGLHQAAKNHLRQYMKMVIKPFSFAPTTTTETLRVAIKDAFLNEWNHPWSATSAKETRSVSSDSISAVANEITTGFIGENFLGWHKQVRKLAPSIFPYASTTAHTECTKAERQVQKTRHKLRVKLRELSRVFWAMVLEYPKFSLQIPEVGLFNKEYHTPIPLHEPSITENSPIDYIISPCLMEETDESKEIVVVTSRVILKKGGVANDVATSYQQGGCTSEDAKTNVRRGRYGDTPQHQRRKSEGCPLTKETNKFKAHKNEHLRKPVATDHVKENSKTEEQQANEKTFESYRTFQQSVCWND